TQPRTEGLELGGWDIAVRPHGMNCCSTAPFEGYFRQYVIISHSYKFYYSHHQVHRDLNPQAANKVIKTTTYGSLDEADLSKDLQDLTVKGKGLQRGKERKNHRRGQKKKQKNGFKSNESTGTHAEANDGSSYEVKATLVFAPWQVCQRRRLGATPESTNFVGFAFSSQSNHNVPVLILLSYLSTPISASSPACYYPGGIAQPNDTPCNPTASTSVCCAPEDICLSNGLCYRANINRLHRGSCTDPTFSSPLCTNICTSPADSPFGFADVLLCPLSDQWYCGWGNQSRCENGPTFKLADGYFADFRNGTASEEAVTGSVTAGVTGGVMTATACGAAATVTVTTGWTPQVTGTGAVMNGEINGITTSSGTQNGTTQDVVPFDPISAGISVRATELSLGCILVVMMSQEPQKSDALLVLKECYVSDFETPEEPIGADWRDHGLHGFQVWDGMEKESYYGSLITFCELPDQIFTILFRPAFDVLCSLWNEVFHPIDF
ncbi:MAG: hypothetical protein Q9166_003240, partial [cf. Caloplaca sp. 2 TL-2023]